MARYIDAEILKAEFYLHYGDHVDAFARLIDKQPTADVAPKSEVAREIIDIIEQRITLKRELYQGVHDSFWDGVRIGTQQAYQDIKEILNQKFTGDWP